MDGDGLKIVQVDNSLDVELAWHFHHHHGRSADEPPENRFNEKYAVKVGKSLDTGPDTETVVFANSVSVLICVQMQVFH